MKKMLTDNLMLKILSVLMAILIWIVVLNINDPSKTRTIAGVRVVLLNEDIITENNQVYDILDGQLVSITFTGPRTIVDTLKASDFTVTADFKDLSQANSIPINVELSEYAYQQKVSIDKKSHNTVQLAIENLATRDYDIEVKYIGETADNYVIADTKLDTSTVKITAPESVHKDIRQVSVNIDISGVMDDFEKIVPVKVYDSKAVELIQAENNVTVDVASIKASSTVYYTKRIPVTYGEITSSINRMEISDIQLSMNEVPVMGRKETLDGITQLVLPTDNVVIDGENSEVEVEYNLEELLPEGVYLNNTSNLLKLTVFLTEMIQRAFTISIEDIGIKNIPDGMDASIVDSGTIRATIEGTKHLVEELDTDSISASVSLRNLPEGVSSVPVELQLPEGVTQAGDVYVRVNLVSTESRQTTEPPTEPEPTTEPTTAPPETITNNNETETTKNETEDESTSSETHS